MRLALEVESLDDVAKRIETLMRPVLPTGMLDKLKLLPMLAEVGGFFPKTVDAKKAPCKEVILRGEDVDVLKFPVLQTWPQDGGRFITLPCVVTRDPKSGKRNVGMYRMQVYDGKTTGMHWQRQKVAAEHLRERLRAETADAAGAVEMMALTAGGDGCRGQRGRRCADGTDEDSRRADGGGCGDWHRSGDDLQRDRARAARD
jgi:4-hydroxy-3-polyprenylbenzoate decarboxylase